jgi:S-adenosylmethionine hydrolase
MALVTLTTDFGVSSPYVAQMKGVIHSLAPSATIVDITHAIAPQDIFAGAIALADAAPWFPSETIHIGVVDPGVGTSRRLIAARVREQWFLAPDNGLLTGVLRHSPASEIFAIENRALFVEHVSHTFHGRDILAPVAARLSLGVRGNQLGPLVDQLVELDWPTPRISPDEIVGQIIAVDSFGNLISNITEGHFRDWSPSERPRVRCGAVTIDGLVHTYGEAGMCQWVALFGSSGRLEIAVVSGNAAAQSHLARGAALSLHR